MQEAADGALDWELAHLLTITWTKGTKVCNQATLALNLPTAKVTPCFRAEAGEYIVQERNLTSL